MPALAGLALLLATGTTPGLTFCAGPGVARVLARQTGRPIVAFVLTGDFPSERIRMAAENPEVWAGLSDCHGVLVDSPDGLQTLFAPSRPPDRSQVVFLDGNGRVLKRLGGFVRPSDLRVARERVAWAALREGEAMRTPKEPGAEADLATIAAMRGDLKRAGELLQAAKLGSATGSQLASAYEAMADEQRLRGDFKGTIESSLSAIRLASDPELILRTRIRVAGTLIRLGRPAEGLDQARRALTATTDSNDLRYVKALIDRGEEAVASLAKGQVRL